MNPHTEARIGARVAQMQLLALAGDEVDNNRLDRLVRAVVLPISDIARRNDLGDRLITSFVLALTAVDIIDVSEAIAATADVLTDIEASWYGG